MIGVIADDLTGAAELGGIGLCYGLKAEVVLHGECNGDADLLCVDTDSRSCTAREAERRAATAARKLRKAGAAWIYKKVDSVLRGNVVAEVEAIRIALGCSSALLIPANPCFGRVIRGGRYFVRGKPIHQTDFARDPEYPRRSSNVLKMLGVSRADKIEVKGLADYRPGSGIVLGEASSSADIQQWASRRDKSTLLAGGAEFFAAVLRAREPLGAKKMEPPDAGCYEGPYFAAHMLSDHEPGQRRGRGVVRGRTTIHGKRISKRARELFVCGSTSDYTEQFVNNARRNGTPVFSLIEKRAKGILMTTKKLESITEKAIVAFENHTRVVLAVGRPLIERRGVARQLAQFLVEIAAAVMEGAKPGHIYAEGGATAAELVRRIGWSRMRVLKELAPGVTTLILPARGAPLLTIKPGSYPGWPKLS